MWVTSVGLCRLTSLDYVYQAALDESSCPQLDNINNFFLWTCSGGVRNHCELRERGVVSCCVRNSELLEFPDPEVFV